MEKLHQNEKSNKLKIDKYANKIKKYKKYINKLKSDQ